MKTRKQKALDAFDYLEDILEIREGKDFVEIIGGIGGDVGRYRAYFDENNNIKYICEK